MVELHDHRPILHYFFCLFTLFLSRLYTDNAVPPPPSPPLPRIVGAGTLTVHGGAPLLFFNFLPFERQCISASPLFSPPFFFICIFVSLLKKRPLFFFLTLFAVQM
jgi:hypothetical protein